MFGCISRATQREKAKRITIYARVTKDDKRLESISYTENLSIKNRRVYDPETGKLDYRMLYEQGILIQKVYYGEKKTEHGTQSIILRKENF